MPQPNQQLQLLHRLSILILEIQKLVKLQLINILKKTSKEFNECIEKFFATLFQTKHSYDTPKFILVYLFTLFAFIVQIKVSLLEAGYITAGIFDMVAEQVWYRIKSQLNQERIKLGKGLNDCLIFHCANPGVPFYDYTEYTCVDRSLQKHNSKADSSEADNDEIPFFCKTHEEFAKSLNPEHKHTMGRFLALLLPEKGSGDASKRPPDHYRSSLGVFMEKWCGLGLKGLSQCGYTSLPNAVDGAAIQIDGILAKYMRFENFHLVLAIRLFFLSNPVCSNNVAEISLALVRQQENGEPDLVSLLDEKREKIMEGHKVHFLHQKSDAEELSLFETLARNPVWGEMHTSQCLGPLMGVKALKNFFLMRCDDHNKEIA